MTSLSKRLLATALLGLSAFLGGCTSKTEKDTLIHQAEERLKGQAIEQFVNYLKARANIQVSQDYLASVPDSGPPLDGGPRRRR